MVSEIQELKAECSGYRARLEKIKSATNHVTPQEKEKVRDEITQQIILETEWRYRSVFPSASLYDSALLIVCTFTGLQRAGYIREGVEEEKEIGMYVYNMAP